MIAHARPCSHESRRKHGKTADGTQRYRCKDCGATFTEKTALLGGMRIDLPRAEMIIKCLVEGNSVSATARMTDTDPHTVLDLLLLVGNRCKRFMESEIRRVCVDDVQVDEVWQFIYCKQKTANRKKLGADVGDSWCFTGVERGTKLLVAWHFGKRTTDDAEQFCEKLANATAGRFRLSTDGFSSYRTAVPRKLTGRVDYGMLVKIFGKSSDEDERRYSPAKIESIRKEVIMGNPDKKKICTSHTERQNLTMRTFVRRMTRLTCCFSKKWENHEAMLALYFCHYNWVRWHKTIETTPAVKAGLANHEWTVRELIEKTCNS